jgi:hypothetical protein
MRRTVASFLAGVALALGAGTVLAADEAGPKPAVPQARPGASLDLWSRARSMSITPEVLPAPSIEVEAQRAPTGAGTMQWPSTSAEIAPGVWVSVMPSCRPEDELWRLPPARARRAPRR